MREYILVRHLGACVASDIFSASVTHSEYLSKARHADIPVVPTSDSLKKIGVSGEMSPLERRNSEMLHTAGLSGPKPYGVDSGTAL